MLGLLLTISSAVMATEQTTYDWTGAYVGVNLGSAWTGSKLTANHSNFLSDTNTYSEQLNSTAVNPEMQVGYLKQLPGNWIVSDEGDFSYPATDSQYRFSDGKQFDQFTVHNNV